MPEMSHQVDEGKYITFKRSEFLDVMNEWVAPAIRNAALRMALADAVVIRRQDFFAPAALKTMFSASPWRLDTPDSCWPSGCSASLTTSMNSRYWPPKRPTLP